MSKYSLSHVSDQTLLNHLSTLVGSERGRTAEILAHIAEVEERRLYAPAGHPSMLSYCVHVLHYSDDAALKRIRAARAAREFPVLFDALVDGRLHLTAVVRLAPNFTTENVEALVAAAAYRTKVEVEELLADRFGRDSAASVTSLQLVPEPVGPDERSAIPEPGDSSEHGRPANSRPVPEPVGFAAYAKLTPLSRDWFELKAHLGKDTRDKLNRLQALLSHRIPSGNLAQVLDWMLDLSISTIEKRKFGATDSPRAARSCVATGKRCIQNHVRRVVRERDGERCTFVSDDGHRCPATKWLEFDHVDPVAHGGCATAGNLRLRCRAHNQYEAERTFGVEFMRNKRAAARRAAADERERRTAEAADTKRRAARAKAQEVIPYLRKLGFRAAETREAAAYCETIPDASLEECVRRALAYLCPRKPSRGLAWATP